MKTSNANAAALSQEFNWFASILQQRFSEHFQHDTDYDSIFALPPPELAKYTGTYVSFIQGLEEKVAQQYAELSPLLIMELKLAHRLAILLALAPHLKPELLDIFFTKNTLFDRGFTEFGGLKGKQHNGFLPTGETLLFVLAGTDIAKRILFHSLLADHHFFYLENMLFLRSGERHEPLTSGMLTISEELLTLFTTGEKYAPSYSTNFPASKLSTKLSWKDLVVPPLLREELAEMYAWLEHQDTLLQEWSLDKLVKPGYRALFYGPPGTGKTLAATLLGQLADVPVYRIDLSQIVSKYIGETEKNLANIFNQAEHRNWILFFDEADALFGKRTSTKDAKDRYANQEIAYLLQRIEDFAGVIILATNLKGNIDTAFARRFQSMIYFPMPGVEQRLQLWQNAFPATLNLQDVDLPTLARKYEIAGGGIVNVVRYAALAAARRKDNIILQRDIIQGIRKEFRKTGKTI